MKKLNLTTLNIFLKKINKYPKKLKNFYTHIYLTLYTHKIYI